jgi:hypothetical protein
MQPRRQQEIREGQYENRVAVHPVTNAPRPRFWSQNTLYHIKPRSAGMVVLNMPIDHMILVQSLAKLASPFLQAQGFYCATLIFNRMDKIW